MALALIGIGVAIVGRVLRRRRLPAAARPVESRILVCYVLGGVALLLYLAQADFVMDRLRPLFAEGKSADRYQGILTVLWPTLWLCAMLPLIFAEISYAPMDVARTLEPDRVRRSSQSGALLALTLCLLFVINYISAEYDKKADLSYFKTTRPSESSKRMVANLSQKVQAVLFFPGTNEVQDEAEAFFGELRGASRLFETRTVDHALEPILAKELNVSSNGSVVLVRDKQHEEINLGTTIARAKNKLKRLDQEFQTAFRKLQRQQRVAYFTVGHEERSTDMRDNVRGSSIKFARELLEELNYSVRDLGIAQGLGSEVPADATVVLVVGPRKDFIPAEVEALKRYLERGGRLLLFVDPEAGLTFDGLLKPFGLKFTPTKLANDKFHVRLTYTDADRNVLFSNRFSAHASVTTVTQNAHRVVTIVLGAGYLEEVPPTASGIGKPQVQFTVHSMPETFNDVNGNRLFDAGSEQRKVFELAAAVTMRVRQVGSPKPPEKGKKAEPPEAQLVVVADSDMLSDQVFRNAGNGYLFLDTLKWMGGEAETIGETTSEEDVRIVHTREKDRLWFYLTIFGVPALVLAAGLTYTRAIRRRRRP